MFLSRTLITDKKAQWTCHLCSTSFARKDLYQRHLGVNHALAPESAIDDGRNSSTSGMSIDQESIIRQPLDEDNDVPITLEHGVQRVRADQALPMSLTEMPLDQTDLSWLDDIDNWKSGVLGNQWSRLSAGDLDWFWQNQDTTFDFTVERTASPELQAAVPLIHTFIQERDSSGHYAPPRYLQDAKSKAFVASPEGVEPPNCGFPICNALTQDRRIELLMDLREIMEIDIRDPGFSLNNMKQGIHLFSREIATEYSFVHRELLGLRDDKHQSQSIALLDVMGAPPGAQLIWSIISFGWALMRSVDNHEFNLASQVQRAIRSSVFTVSPFHRLSRDYANPITASEIDQQPAALARPNVVHTVALCKISGHI